MTFPTDGNAMTFELRAYLRAQVDVAQRRRMRLDRLVASRLEGVDARSRERERGRLRRGTSPERFRVWP